MDDLQSESFKSEIQTIQLVHDHVLKQIEHLFSSPQGCQGVTLMRGMLKAKGCEEVVIEE
jgi:hypothetical protein